MGERARRVFLSHTSELRRFPRDRSFIAAAEAAVMRAGHVVADMAYFTARNAQTAQYCEHMVAHAQVYVGVIGHRYGSLVRDRPDISYTELEFNAATELGLPRLIFLLDEEAELPLPANQIIDLVHGRRQARFRRRLRQTSLAVGTVVSPAELETRLYQALAELTVADEEDEPVDGAVGRSVAVPFGRLPVEVRGREDLLGSLDAARGLVVLAGMGGVGKSTVAAELARRVQQERPAWWVSAADASSLAAGLVTVARRLGAGRNDLEALATHAADAPDRLWALLRRAREGWVLVLDNADQPDLLGPQEASVADGTGWFRADDRGLLLVTSRLAGGLTWGRQARIHRLGPISDAAAAGVLLDLAPNGGGRAEAEALGRRLGGLPLALHLAGSYLGSGISRISSFAGYEAALQRVPDAARLLTPDPDTASAADPRAALMSTWELSLDDLRRRGLPQARTVLRLLSCFAPGVPIPMHLLDVGRLAGLLSADAAGADASPADAGLEQALRGLARVGLVDSVAGQEVLIVHHTIAAINRAHLITPADSPEPRPRRVREAAADLVVSEVGRLSVRRTADWPRFRGLAPHLLDLLGETAPHLGAEQVAALVAATNTVVVAFHRFGAASTSRDLTDAALRCGQSLGDRHPAVLEARNHLAIELRWQGQMARAAEILRDLLDVERASLGADHRVTLATRHQLARTALRQGRYGEAEAAYRALLEDARRVLGDDHPDTLSTEHELARTLTRLDRPAEAEALLRDVVAAEIRVLGPDHPDTLATRHRLARTIAAQGRLAEAEATLSDVLDTRRAVLGDLHHLTLSTRVGLARVVADQGRLAEAEAVLREVLEVRTRQLGDDHPSTLATGHHLALTLMRTGARAEAEALLASVVDGRRRTMGDDHPETSASVALLDQLRRAPTVPDAPRA